ncbi:MAG: nucleotide pyrophosphohydrolase [Gammaproteobacteria bacterium]|nr:MAG: nucleotide pyrophosphohydrolase [Gammaproteobacteria bacterium]
MALIAEAGELIEHFQWLTEEESLALPEDRRRAVVHEMADVFIYLLRLADRLGIDLEQAAWEKIAQNERRYPKEKVRGSARRAEDYE